MPASNSQFAVDPEERAAWSALESAEVALHAILSSTLGSTAAISGMVYFLDENQRLVSAPTNAEGLADVDQARHRSEYEGMSAVDLWQLEAAIESWIRERTGSQRQAARQS